MLGKVPGENEAYHGEVAIRQRIEVGHLDRTSIGVFTSSQEMVDRFLCRARVTQRRNHPIVSFSFALPET